MVGNKLSNDIGLLFLKMKIDKQKRFHAIWNEFYQRKL